LENLRIESASLDGALVLAASGEIDLATSPRLRETVEAELERGVPLVLDLSEVTFLDSSGIRVLLGCAARAQAGGTRFTVIPSDAVGRTLELCGITDAVLLVAADRRSAVRAPAARD
jgi:anti-sigma B factor antagonist